MNLTVVCYSTVVVSIILANTMLCLVHICQSYVYIHFDVQSGANYYYHKSINFQSDQIS